MCNKRGIKVVQNIDDKLILCIVMHCHSATNEHALSRNVKFCLVAVCSLVTVVSCPVL